METVWDEFGLSEVVVGSIVLEVIDVVWDEFGIRVGSIVLEVIDVVIL